MIEVEEILDTECTFEVKVPSSLTQVYIVLFLLMNPCIDCGESDIRVLEFHHLDPKKKRFNIGSSRSRVIDDVANEVAKCVVLCSNCHRKRTWPDSMRTKLLDNLNPNQFEVTQINASNSV